MEQIIKVKCPHCGWIRSIDVHAYEDISATDVARDAGDEFKAIMAKIRNLMSTSTVDAANAWVDMKCSYCHKTYGYNVKTREVKP